MFGWFKRSDGFEWREYVRTTILLKRKKRKEKIKQVGAAAIDGLKAAGKAGATAGASGAASLRPAVGRVLAAGIRAPVALLAGAARILGPQLVRLRKLLARGLGPLLAVISPPHLRGPVGVIGAVALAAAAARWPGYGLDSQTMIAGSIGLGALALAGLPWLLSADRLGLPTWLSGPLRRSLGHLSGLPRPGPGVAGGLLLALLAGAAGWVGWNYAQSGGPSAVLAGLPLVSAKPIEGRATPVGADILRVGTATIRLAGIEAPEREQKCKRAGGGKSWPCGQSAAEALARFARGKTASCELSGKDDAGNPLGTCRIDGKDIAAELVRGGHVFATTGFFSRYSAAESEAKAAKAGVWRGDGERPGEWRAKRWEQAKRAAPDGCPIKGHVTDEGRVYVLPWSPAYDSVKVRTNRGERWFCTEQEARAAGWRAHQRG